MKIKRLAITSTRMGAFLQPINNRVGEIQIISIGAVYCDIMLRSGFLDEFDIFVGTLDDSNAECLYSSKTLGVADHGGILEVGPLALQADQDGATDVTSGTEEEDARGCAHVAGAGLLDCRRLTPGFKLFASPRTLFPSITKWTKAHVQITRRSGLDSKDRGLIYDPQIKKACLRRPPPTEELDHTPIHRDITPTMSSNEQPYITLTNGLAGGETLRMPMIGLGCYAGHEKEAQDAFQPCVLSALEVGYRHIDTAHSYGTEAVVGRAIRESGIPRKDIWITTKLPNEHHAPSDVSNSFAESLERLGFPEADNYFDLYLMHWPQALAEPIAGGVHKDVGIPFTETWAAIERLLDTGRVRSIGVSNFSVKNLKTLLETAKIKPAVNQVEMHPHQVQPELSEFCKKEGIVLAAYSPTGYSQVANDPIVKAIATKHNVSPAQVSLAWNIARGSPVVPKSTNAERQRSNLWGLPTLTGEEVKQLESLHKNEHYCEYDCPAGTAFGWTYEQLGW